LYLIETYDKDGKLSYQSSPEKHLTEQWLMFQVSGGFPPWPAAWNPVSADLTTSTTLPTPLTKILYENLLRVEHTL
jgi:hypothetical protein